LKTRCSLSDRLSNICWYQDSDKTRIVLIIVQETRLAVAFCSSPDLYGRDFPGRGPSAGFRAMAVPATRNRALPWCLRCTGRVYDLLQERPGWARSRIRLCGIDSGWFSSVAGLESLPAYAANQRQRQLELHVTMGLNMVVPCPRSAGLRCGGLLAVSPRFKTLIQNGFSGHACFGYRRPSSLRNCG
jgi:hypothetical protein